MILLMFVLSRWSGGLVTHHGARIPLVLGPLIVGAGFLLFALAPAQGRYWTTLFPATLVLGFGMAVTVPPLTTVVMSSVDQARVGTASGINNAVARVAGVLAIALLGIVMVKTFSSRLNQSIAKLSLPTEIVRDIRSKQIELAGLELPQGLDANTLETLRRAIANAFLSSFRLVMFLCAALSTASAMVAWLLIAPAVAAPGRAGSG
jgi:MFS family permease